MSSSNRCESHGRQAASPQHAFARIKSGPAIGLLLFAGALALLAGCASHPKGPHGPACSTIDGATNILFYPSQRLTILKRVAKQKDLSQHEQIYLVNAVFMGGFGDDMADALVSLISNRCCTAETRQHIRKCLKICHMVGRAERRVLEALKKYSPPEEQAAG